MSIKSRLEALESVKGGVISFKMIGVCKDGTFMEYPTEKILTKKDDNYFYEDGTPLHGDTKEENTITFIISTKDEHPQNAFIRERK